MKILQEDILMELTDQLHEDLGLYIKLHFSPKLRGAGPRPITDDFTTYDSEGYRKGAAHLTTQSRACKCLTTHGPQGSARLL